MSVLPGSVYKYNTNRLPSAIREIPIPRSIQSPRKLGLCTDLGIGISQDSPQYPVGIMIIKQSSRHPVNQFLSIEYVPSFQTLLDKIANYGENSVFRNSENFHVSDKFCLGVNTRVFQI